MIEAPHYTSAGSKRDGAFALPAEYYDGTVNEQGMRCAGRLAAGPTLAHAATKRIVRAYLRGGVDRADEVTPKQFAGLFASQDLRGAVRSFLAEGPGKATFEGR